MRADVAGRTGKFAFDSLGNVSDTLTGTDRHLAASGNPLPHPPSRDPLGGLVTA